MGKNILFQNSDTNSEDTTYKPVYFFLKFLAEELCIQKAVGKICTRTPLSREENDYG